MIEWKCLLKLLDMDRNMNNLFPSLVDVEMDVFEVVIFLIYLGTTEFLNCWIEHDSSCFYDSYLLRITNTGLDQMYLHIL